MLLYGDIYIAFVSSLKTYGHLDNLYFMGEIRGWGNGKGGISFIPTFITLLTMILQFYEYVMLCENTMNTPTFNT